MDRNEYNLLKMDSNQDLGDFLAKFTRLAEESTSLDLRKQDLYAKIPTLIQNQVMMDVDDESATLDQFVRKCQRASGLISQQHATRNLNKANDNKKNDGNGGNTAKNITTTPNNYPPVLGPVLDPCPRHLGPPSPRWPWHGRIHRLSGSGISTGQPYDQDDAARYLERQPSQHSTASVTQVILRSWFAHYLLQWTTETEMLLPAVDSTYKIIFSVQHDPINLNN
ncbi:hypothetical protein NUU61_005243 [Penicillium alfredii]|uniref:Uncharacterized protein n=1 Tax=Penicillium alfredii TaxID=1506179 RepID=A0A9W9F9G9_9EURO|nr:uncharacterized protein NUU61_005243 [Penicillium alfredii]KAJ5095887.1 hypothetical protein NUU61_005243 [Penicillium alfredii]